MTEAEKTIARYTARYAITSGRLTRQPCEVCGVLSRVQAHHDDYSKALQVRWLCPLHHKWLHAYGMTIDELRRIAA